MTERFVYTLEECHAAPRPAVGGKAAGLGAVAGLGLPIPAGFAVTTDAYRESLGPDTLAELKRASGGEARALVEAARPHANVEKAVRAAYADLCDRCGEEDLAVAVRSSASSEDTSGASFAGEYETYLWIRGADAVLDAMVRCWASLYGERALSYREHEHVEGPQAMGVLVQEMVDAVAAGVLFSLNPENGDRSKVAIESCFGLGELVVAGEITPDSFLLDKVTGEVLRRGVTPKPKRLVFDRAAGFGVVEEPVPAEQQEEPSLSDDQLEELRGYARTAERTLGFPVDMEWAAGRRRIAVLQVRPETVWSRRSREPAAAAGSVMDTILASLTGGES